MAILYGLLSVARYSVNISQDGLPFRRDGPEVRLMLLSVSDLRTRFEVDEGELWPVNGVSFAGAAGETLGLGGESGSGTPRSSGLQAGWLSSGCPCPFGSSGPGR